MEIQLQITSRNIHLSDAIRSEIQKRAEKLDKFYDRITRCRVVIESPHRHQSQGKLYNVNIDLTVPGKELIVKKQPHQDLYVAIRDSFNAAHRKLEDFARRQRGDIKQHEEMPLARISSLYPEMGYGFITTPDNQEIYFHENSVLNRKFDHLTLGMEVRFVEERGEKGLQASTVTII